MDYLIGVTQMISVLTEILLIYTLHFIKYQL